MSDLTRPIQPMPELVKTALRETGLGEQYDARPAYQRNDYLWGTSIFAASRYGFAGHAFGCGTEIFGR